MNDMISDFLVNALRSPAVHANAVSRFVGRAGWRVHCMCNNYNFDMESNGERALMDALAPNHMKTVFDVGAYKGRWSSLAFSILAPSVIHAFEPVPASFAKLEKKLAGHDAIKLHQCACGERRESIPMVFNKNQPTRSGFHARTRKYENLDIVDVAVVDGASFCAEHGIETIDFLKIDAEGHEKHVIAGFAPLLDAGRIRVVQFEYSAIGTLYDVSLWRLFEGFEQRGYIVGKIFPDGVAFAPFSSLEDAILGPNYCAVLASEHEIINSVHAPRRTDADYVKTNGGPLLNP